MTVAQILTKVDAHLAAALDGYDPDLSIHPGGQPDTVAAPAAWIELPTGRRASSTSSALTVTVRTIVAFRNRPAGPTTAAVVDVVDRLSLAWRRPPAGLVPTSWAWSTSPAILLGDVEHTGVTFDVVIEYPNVC
jgi:hypothetical protein